MFLLEGKQLIVILLLKFLATSKDKILELEDHDVADYLKKRMIPDVVQQFTF